jgi:hypothetical protein
MVPPRVAIVSVTYNRCGPLAVLLSQLRALDYPSPLTQVFLVDNASTDDTVERVRRQFPEVRLTVAERNLGTSAGFNAGMREALADARAFDYVWLLDSDAEVASGTLRPLVSAMQADARLGIVGSAVYDPSSRERLVTAGLRVDFGKGTVHLVKLPPGRNGLVDADFVPACSLLVRSALCRELGLWDERYWVYWGDTDWCLKAQRGGYRVGCHLESRAWHRDWANTKRSFQAPSALYDDLRGGLLFYARHAPKGSLKGARRLLLRSYAKAAVEHLTTRPHFSGAVDAAVAHFLGGRFETGRYEPPDGPGPLLDVEEICRRLPARVRPRPTVLLCQIEADGLRRRITDALLKHLPEARLLEIRPRRRPSRSDFTTDTLHFLRFEVPELLWRLVRRRHDVVVSEIESPHLCTLVAGKVGILLDSQARGVVQEHAARRELARAAQTLFRGLKAALWDLPAALRANQALRGAVVGGSRAAGGVRA